MQTDAAPQIKIKLPPDTAERAAALVAQAQNLKPGWQTTEFGLHAVVVLAITLFVALGKLDATLGATLLAADATLYQLLRGGLKKDAVVALLNHIASMQPSPLLAVAEALKAGKVVSRPVGDNGPAPDTRPAVPPAPPSASIPAQEVSNK